MSTKSALSPDAPCLPARLGGSRPRAKIALLLLLLLPYIIFLASCYSVFCVTTDDAFITFRYAANIWAGHGAVFNIGQRVEGFTSPLHLFLIVLLCKLLPSVDLLFKAKLLGIGFGAGVVWLTGRLARRTGLGDCGALFAQLLVAANSNFAVAAVNGMETTLYAFLVTLALISFLQEAKNGDGAASSLWLVLAVLARPDAFGVFVLLLAVRILWAIWKKRSLKEPAVWALLFLVYAACITLVRWSYYGQLLPNTYYAKDVLLRVGLGDGIPYLLHPLFPVAIDLRWPLSGKALHGQAWPIVSTGVFWVLAIVGAYRMRRSYAGWALAAVSIAYILFILRFGGDWMPGWRFMIPALPPLAALQCHALRGMKRSANVTTWQSLCRFSVGASAAAFVVWGICAVVAPHNPWSNARFSTRAGTLLAADSRLGRKWVVGANYLRQTAAPGSVVAYSEMGYAGYLNPGVNFIDVRGLTDPQIARLPAKYKGPWGIDDENWFQPGNPLYKILIRRNPSVILAFSWPANIPLVVLNRYCLTDTLSDPHDSYGQIMPILVYQPVPRISLAP